MTVGGFSARCLSRLWAGYGPGAAAPRAPGRRTARAHARPTGASGGQPGCTAAGTQIGCGARADTAMLAASSACGPTRCRRRRRCGAAQAHHSQPKPLGAALGATDGQQRRAHLDGSLLEGRPHATVDRPQVLVARGALLMDEQDAQEEQVAACGWHTAHATDCRVLPPPRGPHLRGSQARAHWPAPPTTAELDTLDACEEARTPLWNV